jgi:hypothetical protein
MVRIFFFLFKKKHTQISFFLFLNVYLYTRIMRLFVDFSFFGVCVHVSFRDKWSRNRYRSFKACFRVCTGSLKRAALPRGGSSVLPWSSGQKKSLSSISGTCEQIVVEVDGTLATQKKMEKGPFSVDVRSIRHSAAALPSPTIAPTSRETSGEGGGGTIIRETHYQK